VLAPLVPPDAADFGEVAGPGLVVGVFIPVAPGPAAGSGGVAALGSASAWAECATGVSGWAASEAVRCGLPLVLVIALGWAWTWAEADDGDWPLKADRAPGAGAAEFVPPALVAGESAVPVDVVRESPLDVAALLGSTLAEVLCAGPAAPLCVDVSVPSDPAEVAEDREASPEGLEPALSGRAPGLLGTPAAPEAPCALETLALLDVGDPEADTLPPAAEPLETA